MKQWAALTAIGLAVGLTMASGLARAQLGADHSNGPVDITADEAEVVNSKCLAIWRGSAEAIQGQSRLRANVINVYSRPKGVGANGEPNCAGIDHIEAEGDVYYVTPTQVAHGDHAVYVAADDQVVMTGNVIVVEGKNVARGDRLVIGVSSHQAQMQSSVKGRDKPGRVRGVFYPSQQTPGAPGVAPASAPAAPPAG